MNTKTTNLLAKALETDDLDAALAPIMTALGIEDGDVAAQAFSGVEWKKLGAAERRDRLVGWLRLELVYAEAD
jgi:hypothetical protein